MEEAITPVAERLPMSLTERISDKIKTMSESMTEAKEKMFLGELTLRQLVEFNNDPETFENWVMEAASQIAKDNIAHVAGKQMFPEHYEHYFKAAAINLYYGLKPLVKENPTEDDLQIFIKKWNDSKLLPASSLGAPGF